MNFQNLKEGGFDVKGLGLDGHSFWRSSIHGIMAHMPSSKK